MTRLVHQAADDDVLEVHHTTCCIVGGGPAGAVLALLLARQGIPVILLEMHKNFDRKFRGDTLHPAILEIMDEIGLAERLHQLRHVKVYDPTLRTADGPFRPVDFRRLKTLFPYVMFIPQPRFLEFLTEEAKRFAQFRLVMGANVERLVEENGVVRGIRHARPGRDLWHFRPLRLLAGGLCLPQGALPGAGREGPRGNAPQNRRARTALAKHVEHLTDWHQFSLLSVESSRCPRWYKAGLLLIGDAAHVMSPVGGVGINYAIQDAVVAANVLTGPLKAGRVRDRDLAEVQRQREWPTRIIQAIQSLFQKQVVTRALRSPEVLRVPRVVRLLLRIPVLRDLPARIIAFAPKRVHVRPCAE